MTVQQTEPGQWSVWAAGRQVERSSAGDAETGETADVGTQVVRKAVRTSDEMQRCAVGAVESRSARSRWGFGVRSRTIHKKNKSAVCARGWWHVECPENERR